MSNALYSLTMILIIALVTMALRFIPFFIFSGDRPVPKFVTYLGRVLPYSIMAMLLFPYGKEIPYLVSFAALYVIWC